MLLLHGEGRPERWGRRDLFGAGAEARRGAGVAHLQGRPCLVSWDMMTTGHISRVSH